MNYFERTPMNTMIHLLCVLGYSVTSKALGRVGPVVDYCKLGPIVKTRRGRAAECFNTGDAVALVQTGPKAWEIVDLPMIPRTVRRAA